MLLESSACGLPRLLDLAPFSVSADAGLFVDPPNIMRASTHVKHKATCVQNNACNLLACMYTGFAR
jgi:hypothetical protein